MKEKMKTRALCVHSELVEGDGAASDVQIISTLQGATSDQLKVASAKPGDDGTPLRDSGRADFQRPRDIRGALKVIKNVLLEHEPRFTIVKSQLQPKYQSKHLTSVDMDKHQTLADRLRSAMEDSKVTASDLARACGVSPAAVAKWLRGGKLSADNLAQAGKRLNVSDEWLRTGKGPRERAPDMDQQEQDLDRVMDLLDRLRGPLANLAQAIDEIARSREQVRRRKA